MSNEGGLQRQFYDMLMDSQWWSADQLRNYQRSQLSQLLRHAKANVPFYKHRLDAVLKPNGDVDWDRWSEIPIVKRQDMVDHRAAMQATELPAGHGAAQVFYTSGSTGLPIEITVNSLAGLANNGLRWRCHQWNKLDWSKNFCSWILKAPAVAGWPDGTPMGPWGPVWIDSSRAGRTWAIAMSETSPHVIDFMQRHDCRYLNRSPKATYALASESVRLGLPYRLDAILTQGERCGEEERDMFRGVFGAKVVEHYSSKEAGQIAHPCEHGTLHVNEEVMFVEILNENGRPCAGGVSGNLVVTPFFSTAQPLVRYDQGDIAEFGPSCRCGRHSRTLKTLHGRSFAVFRHPDGEVLCRFLPDQSRTLIGASVWQIAQVGPLDFEVRYVKIAEPEADGEARFAALFRQTYWPDCRLTLIQQHEFRPGPSGKHADYISEL